MLLYEYIWSLLVAGVTDLFVHEGQMLDVDSMSNKRRPRVLPSFTIKFHIMLILGSK